MKLSLAAQRGHGVWLKRQALREQAQLSLIPTPGQNLTLAFELGLSAQKPERMFPVTEKPQTRQKELGE